MTALHLDIRQLAPTEDGLVDFYWPVPREELAVARDTVLLEIPRAARAAANPDDARFLSTFGHFIAREMLNLYQAAALVDRARRRGLSVTPPVGSRIFGPLLAGELPSAAKIMSFLVQGYPPRPRWKAPARLLRDLLVPSDGLSRSYFTRPRCRDDIIACGVSELISAHAKSIDERVTYAALNDWFGPLDTDALDATRRTTAAWPVIDDLVNRCAVIFEHISGPLRDLCRQYVRYWLIEAASIIHLRLERLLEKQECLPRRLWTGTGGQPFVRLLRQAVRATGGHVTGHDHAHGHALWKHHAHSYIEFEECDRFVTYSPTQARGLLASANSDHLIQSKLPEIVSTGGAVTARREHAGLTGRGPIRKIMYLMECYYGDENALIPFSGDPVMIDWQARLLGRLGGWGYEVHLKPHPESKFAVPSALIDIVGRPPLDGRFETFVSQFDAVVFDNPFTTTFGKALLSDCAVVLIDFDIAGVREEAREMMSRRCRLVPGWFDDENRAQVDWRELEIAIGESRELTDPTLAITYFGG